MSDETQDERLLRKARDYVERHKDDDDDKKKKSRKRSSRHDHSKTSERKRKDSRPRKRHRKEQEDSDASDNHHRRYRSRKHDKKTRKNKESKRKHGKDKKHAKNRNPKSNLYPLGDIKKSPPAELLDAKKDYFAFHQHLFVYLFREENIVFGDLSSEDAHKAFKRFCKHYNAGELEMAYYEGLPTEAIEECKTTNHKWSFNTSETERRSLQYLQEGVRKQTEYDVDKAESVAPQKEAPKGTVASKPPTNEPKRWTQEERLAERVANRRLKEHARTAEEEMSGGRKDGRERQIEKRKERAEAIHGAAKDREDARMGGVELNDETIYGGGDADFQKCLGS